MVVVPAGDELKDGQFRMATSGPHVAVDQLGLERGEEAFYYGIVPARSWSPDALACLVSRQELAVGGAGVLNAAIRMVDQPWFRAPGRQRHLQRSRSQFGAQMISHCP